MDRSLRILFLVFGFLAFVGCSGVKFQALPSKTCVAVQNEFGASSCVITPEGFNQYNYSVQAGAVDILMIDDNSGSMYTEQVEMANRFPGFLDSIFRLDYRLAIITTDLGANGGFLSFPNGSKSIGNSSRLLDAKHYDNIQQFQNTIKRPETLECDSSGYQNCPSGDERGIFSAILAMGRSDQKSFFRPGGHLAVVVLSDEDERSNGGNIIGYPLEENDLPATFAQKTKELMGSTKTVSVHSIIIRPGDDQCFAMQNSQPGVKGFYGDHYAALSWAAPELKALGNLVDGSVGSICSNNYTNELGNIAAAINQNVNIIQLPCAPVAGQVDVTFDPSPGQQIFYSVSSDNRLQLNPPAPAGTKVNLSFKCKI